MKGWFYCLSAALLFLVACNSEPKREAPENTSEESNGLEIVKRPYRNSEKIEYEISVVKGTTIKHGIQKRYYLHGSLYSTIPYVAGKQQGVACTYYQAALDSEPQIWKEQPYEEDELHGICKRYHRDGTLQAEYEYKNGLRAVGLKEYTESGKEIEEPKLILTKHRVATGVLIQARLSDTYDNVDFYIGELTEGKYLPQNMKALQTRNDVGETVVSQTSGTITITAEYSTRYRNRGVVSNSINL
ncbi:toxin-antitoxin system YwqK family antitoxin [Draconibacterium sediminis]|uniref:toxin-antitoxin system YwqK family antitoxin n=1 Tax=Draconibacterium sediminis TaxID=1544798 RepID=UPI0026EBEF41|nr:hypothetical protein [Draconibacterium sediminis]